MDQERDDESPVRTPEVVRFGNEELVAACKHPERVKVLLEQGCIVTPAAVNAACFVSATDTLALLLASHSPGPDARPQANIKELTLACKDLLSADYAPILKQKDSQYHPLYLAGAGTSQIYEGGKEARLATVSVLLRYKPYLFAEFLQPLLSYQDRCPGQYMSDGREVESISTDTDEEWYEVSSDGEILETETQYAIRSVFHAMLEDGILVEPILSCDGLDFDVNQRDWQEHTLMHAVCRSVIGADVLPKAEAADMRLACDPSLIAAESTGPSLFESLRRRGGDVQARDCRGKNILHHLLDARSYPHPNAYPPLIHNTFKYILQHIPELVNSPDSHGTYPLHAALNRVRAIPFPGDRAELSPLESVVHDLLSAGARPLEVDSRGNTALHYLADCGLGERTDREPRRSLFRYFCRAGVDINARNHIGRTAIELFLDNHSVYERASDSRVPIEERQCDPAQSVHIENELFELLEATGARWTDVDAKGQTLLHWVARSKPWYARSRAIYLLEKGVDPRAKDRKGKTAKDVARAADNKAVVAVLVRWLASIASGQAAQA